MKIKLMAIFLLLLIGCGPGEDGDTINIAAGPESQIQDDPVVQSECGGSDDQCGQQVD